MAVEVSVEPFGDCAGCGGASSRERPLTSVYARTPLGYTVLWAHEGCEAAAVAGCREQPARAWAPKLSISEMIERQKGRAGLKRTEERTA